MIELYRVLVSIDCDAKPLLFYYANLSEYVADYLTAVRQAALAKYASERELALQHLETVLKQAYNCINTLADVAHDRGLISAVLNAFAYCPLLAEHERLAEAE